MLLSLEEFLKDLLLLIIQAARILLLRQVRIVNACVILCTKKCTLPVFSGQGTLRSQNPSRLTSSKVHLQAASGNMCHSWEGLGAHYAITIIRNPQNSIGIKAPIVNPLMTRMEALIGPFKGTLS